MSEGGCEEGCDICAHKVDFYQSKGVRMKDAYARVLEVDSGKPFAIFQGSMAYVMCVLSKFYLLDTACKETPLRESCLRGCET